MSDWSKLSSTIFSQGSDALTEAKQRISQAISQKDLDPQNIDWSEVSSNVISRASNALTEAKQLVNQAASQRDIDLQNVDWSKLSDNIVSRASDLLVNAQQLVDQIMLRKYLDLTNINWSKVPGNILSHAFSALATVLPSVLFALTEINNLSIRQPYTAAGALLFISASTDFGVFLTLSRLTGQTTMFLCFLPVRLVIWGFGFGSRGIEKGSFASQYQSYHYGGNVPRGSAFSQLQSYGATTWVPLTLVSLVSYTGAAIVLGREWGWWLQ